MIIIHFSHNNNSDNNNKWHGYLERIFFFFKERRGKKENALFRWKVFLSLAKGAESTGTALSSTLNVLLTSFCREQNWKTRGSALIVDCPVWRSRLG